MKIDKFSGKTREEAIEKARQKFGDDCVIMHTQRKGVFGSTYIVTAGIEDDAPLPNYKDVFETAEQTQGRFDAVVDEEVRLPVMAEPKEEPPMLPQPPDEPDEAEVTAEALRSTFRAVEEVLAQSNAVAQDEVSAPEIKAAPLTQSTYDKRAALIRYNDPAASMDYTRDSSPRRPRRQQFTPPVEPQAKPAAKDEFSVDTRESELPKQRPETGSRIIRAIYKVLLDHEVDERYINQVLAELDLATLGESSIETALGLVYQKLVLKFGRPRLITFEEKKPKVVFFIGPTGVGKTTTIAKLAADFRFSQKKKVALFTADTYRIAAEAQLAVYGSHMQIDVVVLYVDDKDDINEKIAQKYSRYDLILVDTTGFSHHDEEQRESIHELLDSLSDRYDKQVYLVLSATTKYKDLKEIVDVYKGFTDFDLLFTKLDETVVYGNLLNIKLYADVPLSYVTTGQIVPDDIEVIDSQKMVHSLLGGS